MKKIDDWFFAGLVAGAIGGVGIMLLNGILLLLGIEHGTYWEAMGGLFFNQELLNRPSAQLHGMIDAIGVSAANGVLLSLTLVWTGRDFLYAKSVAMSASGAYFLFLFVYPQTGLGKDSLIVPWIALFGHTVSNGLLSGYILKRIYSFKRNQLEESWTRGEVLESRAPKKDEIDSSKAGALNRARNLGKGKVALIKGNIKAKPKSRHRRQPR